MSSALSDEHNGSDLDRTVRALRALLVQTIGGLGIRRPFALLDYPDEPNVGEAAGWLGALSCLKAATGARPAYVAKRANVDWDRIGRLSGDVIVFGRSTWNETEPSLSGFRDELLRNVGTGRRIIQLPATTTPPQDPEPWADVLIDADVKPTLLVSERASLERLTNGRCAASLIPPMILGLRLRPQPRAGSGAISLPQIPGSLSSLAPDADDRLRNWLEEPLGLHKRYAIRALLQAGPSRARQRFFLYLFMAQSRLARGVSVLGAAQDIVTDRLDAYLLALLLQVRARRPQVAPAIAEFESTWQTPPPSRASPPHNDA